MSSRSLTPLTVSHVTINDYVISIGEIIRKIVLDLVSQDELPEDRQGLVGLITLTTIDQGRKGRSVAKDMKLERSFGNSKQNLKLRTSH